MSLAGSSQWTSSGYSKKVQDRMQGKSIRRTVRQGTGPFRKSELRAKGLACVSPNMDPHWLRQAESFDGTVQWRAHGTFVAHVIVDLIMNPKRALLGFDESVRCLLRKPSFIAGELIQVYIFCLVALVSPQTNQMHILVHLSQVRTGQS